MRPAVRPRGFTVRTGTCEAACAGAVRATTARFWTEAGGVATCDLMFAEPSALCGTGLMPTELVTCALLRAAGVRWTPPRLTAWPFANILRSTAVTARTLCAFTKLTLRMFVLKTFVLRMNVLCTLMTVMKLRLQPNQGKNGSPKPSGNQPTPKPNPPPKKPTKAGPGTIPIRPRNSSSGHSGRERSPTANNQPKSSPRGRPSSNSHRCKEPSQVQHYADTKRGRSQVHRASHRNHPNRCSQAYRAKRTFRKPRCLPSGRAPRPSGRGRPDQEPFQCWIECCWCL